MKSLLKITLSVIIILCTYSCQVDNENNAQENNAIDLSTLSIKLNKLDFTKPQLLFKYKNSDDLNSKLISVNENITKEIDDLMKSNNAITNVLYDINFKNGKAIIDNIYILNTTKKEVLNVSNAKNFPDIDWEGIINGAACPNGWTNQGSCMSANCISETTQEILTGENGINSSGDCVNIQYNREIFGVRICTSGC